ncbi:MAG: hypothetical protein ACPGVU_21315, partial [Limisphaerales bacterium]
MVGTQSAWATAGYATVKKVQGTATIKLGNAQRNLQVGQQLGAGSEISTSANSYVDLDLGVNGDALRIEAESTMRLTTLTFRRLRNSTDVQTEMNVSRGKVVANVVRKLSRSSRYRIRTPKFTAGIRGTSIQAGVNGVIALTGTVELRSTAGGVQLVVGGFAYSAAGNQVGAAGAAQTQGIAAVASSSTANLGNGTLLQTTIQQFAQALASQAAAKAPNAQQAAIIASQTATAVVRALTQAIQREAASAPPAIQAQVQQAVQAVQQQTTAISVTSAAGAAASATAAIVTQQGATPQQAQQQAQQAARSAAQQAGNISIQQSGNSPQAIQQAQSATTASATVVGNTISTTISALAAGGGVDAALNQGNEATSTVSVSATGVASVSAPPTTVGASTSSADIRGFVDQISRLSGQAEGSTVGTLSQIMSDPLLASGAAELIVASKQPGGVAAAISSGGGISSSARTVLSMLGVTGVGGVGASSSNSNAGGLAGAAA